MTVVAKGSWGYHRVCTRCKIFNPNKCLSGSNFWAGICPDCGIKQQVENCRWVVVRTAPLVWWNPLTWFKVKKTVQFLNAEIGEWDV